MFELALRYEHFTKVKLLFPAAYIRRYTYYKGGVQREPFISCFIISINYSLLLPVYSFFVLSIRAYLLPVMPITHDQLANGGRIVLIYSSSFYTNTYLSNSVFFLALAPIFIVRFSAPRRAVPNHHCFAASREFPSCKILTSNVAAELCKKFSLKFLLFCFFLKKFHQGCDAGNRNSLSAIFDIHLNEKKLLEWTRRFITFKRI